MQEVWKDIAGYEGYYQVSNTGVVKSLDRYVPHKTFGKKFVRGHIMATHINNAGYVTVNLSKGNRYTSHDIHRLVALTFMPIPCSDGLEVNHKDENKKNNRLENLEWTTKAENNAWGTKITRQAEKIKVPVVQYTLDGKLVKVWPSAIDAERAISGKVTGAVSHNIKGSTKSAFGYLWKTKEVT